MTLKTALASGHKLAICSGVPYTQNLNLTMYGSFSPKSINKEEDRRVIQLQQILEQMRRCLIVPITSEKTPQEVMTNLLDVAEKAADYAQRAETIYNEVVSTGYTSHLHGRKSKRLKLKSIFIKRLLTLPLLERKLFSPATRSSEQRWRL